MEMLSPVTIATFAHPNMPSIVPSSDPRLAKTSKRDCVEEQVEAVTV
jgi:hypothetical protein